MGGRDSGNGGYKKWAEKMVKGLKMRVGLERYSGNSAAAAAALPINKQDHSGKNSLGVRSA